MMNKNTYQKVALQKGEMHIYDFGAIRLHAYQTHDPLEDEVFILEKAGRAVLIEAPCFTDNERELTDYLQRQNLLVDGMLLAYHMAGAAFLPEAKKYATPNAEDYGHRGGGRALIDQFQTAFGDCFDSGIHLVTCHLAEGPVIIGGIDFIITTTPDAFDIEIPEINAVYTHMLGHDCHSIVAGPGHADATIAQLKMFMQKGYSLILTSHYTPEDLKDAQTKIDYLEQVKAIAAQSQDASAFKQSVRAAYPQYSGDNYLEMTAGFFFA